MSASPKRNWSKFINRLWLVLLLSWLILFAFTFPRWPGREDAVPYLVFGLVLWVIAWVAAHGILWVVKALDEGTP